MRWGKALTGRSTSNKGQIKKTDNSGQYNLVTRTQIESDEKNKKYDNKQTALMTRSRVNRIII